MSSGWSLVIVLALLFPGSRASGSCSTDDAAIYSLVISELHSAEHPDATRLLVPARTGVRGHTPGIAKWIRSSLSPELKSTTLEAYEKACERSVESCELRLPLKPDFFESYAFEQTIEPTALSIELSQIGYSDDGKQALLYEALSWGDWEHGSGHYTLLRRSESGWKVVKRLKAWGPRRVRAPG